MPEFSYQPRILNDQTTLSEGWHPAYLLAITDELTPLDWKMAQSSPRMWKWWFAVWEVASRIAGERPERQSAPTSQKFSPGGQFQEAKAYTWTAELLGHRPGPGEAVTLDPLMPLPCRVKVRLKDTPTGRYANITDLEKWPDGAQYLTPELRQKLRDFLDNGTPPQASGTRQPEPPVTTPPQPGMQAWGGQAAPAPSAPASAAPTPPPRANW